ncbi:unnamed protein product [Oppiella nova]|uniref:Uncharacterized protein n=1 Tax=Oppiella nova TaxID=334625 RepID=A0A7R9QSH6_9ACAR|nr:unnamed protein product [Oppiella nova]CAG2172768.1 unnamed protein product [Oppiella nova]
MFLTSDDCVYGWGNNTFGQLGRGPGSDKPNEDTFRVNFDQNHKIKSIYCCDYSTFAITSEGQVFSWGRNDWYNLGHNSSDNIWEPQLIEDMTGIKTICSGGVVSEVNDYKRLYEELHSLGSGAFGEYKSLLTGFFLNQSSQQLMYYLYVSHLYYREGKGKRRERNEALCAPFAWNMKVIDCPGHHIICCACYVGDNARQRTLYAEYNVGPGYRICPVCRQRSGPDIRPVEDWMYVVAEEGEEEDQPDPFDYL